MSNENTINFDHDGHEEIIEVAVRLCCCFDRTNLDMPDLERSRYARIIAAAEPNALNRTFIEVMDNPRLLYDAWCSIGASDVEARRLIGGLATKAMGGFGLAPSDFIPQAAALRPR